MSRNPKALALGDGMTHFGRAIEVLKTEIIFGHSSQAKNRVERAIATSQDRLVKAMRADSHFGVKLAEGQAEMAADDL